VVGVVDVDGDCEDEVDEEDANVAGGTGLDAAGEVGRGCSNCGGCDDSGGVSVNCQVLEAMLSPSRVSGSGISAPHSSGGNSSSSRLN
jgi:hypothetical protein